jgi:hypothetical protein
LATRISVLYGLHRHFALGQQLAITLDRNVWYEEAPAIANRNLYTGVDFRFRFPYRRLLFWAALTVGYENRHYLLLRAWEGVDRWKSSHGFGFGAGIGIDCFVTPLLAIGVSSWVYRGSQFSVYYSAARPAEELDEGALIHWTVNAGVRIYLSRRAP